MWKVSICFVAGVVNVMNFFDLVTYFTEVSESLDKRCWSVANYTIASLVCSLSMPCLQQIKEFADLDRQELDIIFYIIKMLKANSRHFNQIFIHICYYPCAQPTTNHSGNSW